MERNPVYLIYAPSFDENSGGTLSLHKLCHELNNLGERALLFPMRPIGNKSKTQRLRSLLKREPYLTAPHYNTPLAPRRGIPKNSIAVYPELVSGNPLNCKNVVRWLLHKPGFHTGIANFGVDDQFFFFEDFCNDETYNKDPDTRLRVTVLNPAYYDHGYGTRSGSCYLLRKGWDKPIAHDLTDSIKIDGMSHREIAETFSRCEAFYSYDEESFYSLYAVLCGCVSVIIPSGEKSREHWFKEHPLARYGVAYGMDDIDHAVATRQRACDYLKGLEQEELRMIQRFIAKTYRRFGFAKKKE